MKRNAPLAWVSLFVLLAAATSPLAPSTTTGTALASVSFSTAPLDPRFVRLLEEKKQAETLETAAKAGIAPSPFKFPGILPGMGFLSVQVLPPSFDLRNEGRVTSVKDQAPFSTCWAFAASGSLESTLLPGEAWDFSEYQLAYTAYSGPDAFTKIHPLENNLNQGGNSLKSTALLARRAGPVSEADCPYDPTGSRIPTGSEPVRKHLVDSHFIYSGNLSGDAARLSVKAALQAMGGVASMMKWDPARYLESGDIHSYFYDGSSDPDHGILLVGWNDAYPKEDFRVQPPIDGAWLVKNSWGTGWGDQGYFWVSYADTSLQEAVVFESAGPKDKERLYQYDPLGIVQALGESGGANTTLWAANIFSSASDEEILSVGFWAIVPETTYEIRVYRDTPAGNPVGGSLDGTIAGTAPTAGYHVVELDFPVPQEGGTRFSVVARITTPGFGYPVAVESPMAGYSENARASQGESFVSLDGANWVDLALNLENTNACLKAVSAPTPPETSSGGGGGGGCSAPVPPGHLFLLAGLLVLLRK